LAWHLEKAEGLEHQEVRKIQRTNINNINCETHRVDIQNTSNGGIRRKVVLFTLFGRVRSYRKAIYSCIVASPMDAENYDKRYAMWSSGKGTRAIDIGRFKMCTVRTKLNNWGRKGCHNHNGHQQFPNRYAKIITVGTQEVSQKVVPDEKPSSGLRS
jgi:hypothetical protein